jgi:hypothetical protein
MFDALGLMQPEGETVEAMGIGYARHSIQPAVLYPAALADLRRLGSLTDADVALASTAQRDPQRVEQRASILRQALDHFRHQATDQWRQIGDGRGLGLHILNDPAWRY